MTSTYDLALKRLHTLRGHINPSAEALTERENPSFDLAVARQALWSTFPANYFETFESISEIHGIHEPSLYMAEGKELMRLDTNKFFIRLVNKMFEKGFTTPEKIADNIDTFLSGIISINSIDYCTLTKCMVQYGLYCKTIKNLGTDKHRKLLLDGTSLRTMGCFGLTEMGHGSNVRALATSAEYDPESEEFILHSPNKTAAKFWIGNLAKTAHNAVIFAQLTTLGEHKGLHAFVVEVRDRSNHVAHPGIEIGDCGDKKGAHGIDNGWILFDNYRISRDCLLDRFGAVDKEGRYLTSIKSDNKRFAASIAPLSGGRVLIGRLATEGALLATNITLRFACARKQFGPTDGPEVPLISYPSYQYRMITRFINHFITLIGKFYFY
jgi:acyl-CoA oxidase